MEKEIKEKKKTLLENTMMKSTYILESLCWGLALLQPWCQIVMVASSSATMIDALRIVLCNLIVVYITLVILTVKRGRNHISVAQNILITTACIIFFIYREAYKLFFIIAGSCLAIITLLMVCYILFRKIKDDDNYEQTYNFRLVHVNNIVRKNMSYTAGIIVILSAISWGWNTYTRIQSEKQETINPNIINVVQVMSPYVDSMEEQFELDIYVFQNMPIISKLSGTYWGDLSLEEKKEIGEIIISAELKRYGMQDDVELKFELLDGDVLGSYNLRQNSIVIDTEHVTNGEGYDYLNTLLHQMAHLYQMKMIELYDSVTPEQQQLLIFRDARIYAAELRTYKKEGLESRYVEYSYGIQFLEICAEDTARKQSKYYIEELEEYLFDKEKARLGIY